MQLIVIVSNEYTWKTNLSRKSVYQSVFLRSVSFSKFLNMGTHIHTGRYAFYEQHLPDLIFIFCWWSSTCYEIACAIAFIFGFTALLNLLMSLCNLQFSARSTLPSKPQPSANSDKSKAPSKAAGSKKPAKAGTKQGSIMSFFKKA